jgi:flagellar hook-length control protein FliK
MVVLPPVANLDQAAFPLLKSQLVGLTITTAQGDQIPRPGVTNAAGFGTVLINALVQARAIEDTPSVDQAAPMPAKKPALAVKPGPKCSDKANQTPCSTLANRDLLVIRAITSAINTASLASSPQSNIITDDCGLPGTGKAQPPATASIADHAPKTATVVADFPRVSGGIGRDFNEQTAPPEGLGNGGNMEQPADYRKDSLQTPADPSTPLAEDPPAFAHKTTSADKAIVKEPAEAAAHGQVARVPAPTNGPCLEKAGALPPSAGTIVSDRLGGFPPMAVIAASDRNVGSVVARAVAEQAAAAIAARTETQGQDGHTTVHLQLDPPGLGPVRVHISASGQSISARVVVQEESTRQLIESQVGVLRERLIDTGMTLSKFAVTSDGGGSQNQAYHPPFEQPAQRQLTQLCPLATTPNALSGIKGLKGLVDVIA